MTPEKRFVYCQSKIIHDGRTYQCTRPKGHNIVDGHECVEVTEQDNRGVIMRWTNPMAVNPQDLPSPV